MNDITDSDLGSALRRASEDATSANRPSVASVATALRTRVSGPDDPLGALAAALEYYPVDPAECAGHAPPTNGAEPTSCSCYGSLGADAAQVLPLWARSVAYAPRPLVAARLADLLWTARYGETPNGWAQEAVDAYLASVPDTFGHALEISEGLQRAFVISTEIGDQARRAAVVAGLVEVATRSIESDEPSSGVSLSILQFLADRPSSDRPPALAELLERALVRYRDDPWLLESALDIKASLVEPEQRKRLHRAQVDAFADLARRSDGLLRYAHFEHAIELAERHELPNVDALRREMDADPLPPDPVAEFVARIVGDDNLADALGRFGACLPTEAADAEAEVGETERLAFFGILAVELLARIRGRYGSVSAAGAWFECALIDQTVAPLVAHAIELYEAGDLDASAAALEPRLEQIIRVVAVAADPTVTEPAEDADSGDGKGIADVLAALAGALYEPSRRYLRALLAGGNAEPPRDGEEAEPPGSVTMESAALLVHAACHLRLLQPVEATARR